MVSQVIKAHHTQESKKAACEKAKNVSCLTERNEAVGGD